MGSLRICFCLFLYLTLSHSVVLSPSVFPPPAAGPHPSNSYPSNQSHSLSFPNHFSVSSANTDPSPNKEVNKSSLVWFEMAYRFHYRFCCCFGPGIGTDLGQKRLNISTIINIPQAHLKLFGKRWIGSKGEPN